MRTSCLATWMCICACALLPLAQALSDTAKLHEAQKLRASGNIEGAISSLRSITSKHPDNTRALALLGDCLMDSGDTTEAHATCAICIAISKILHVTLCIRYVACLKLREDDLPCMDGLSMLYLRSGNPQLALPLLERITAIATGTRIASSCFHNCTHCSHLFSFTSCSRWCWRRCSHQPRHRIQKSSPL